MNMREKLARAICEADGCDPDYLEPGDDPYQNNEPVIDGRNAKGYPCHFFWRRYDRIFTDPVLDTLREPTPEMIAAATRAPDSWALEVWQSMITAAKNSP
jgi:hypothetical protein